MPITDAICYLFQAHAQHFLYMLKQFLLSAALIKLKPPGPAHLRFLLRTMPCETTAGGCTGSRWSQARANDNGHMDTWWPQKEATKIVTGGLPRLRCWKARVWGSGAGLLTPGFTFSVLCFAVSAPGFVVSVLGFTDSALVFTVSALGFMISGLGFVDSVLGFVVSVLGFVVSALGFAVSALGFEVLGPGFEVLGLGFEVLGLGFEALGTRAQFKPPGLHLSLQA